MFSEQRHSGPYNLFLQFRIRWSLILYSWCHPLHVRWCRYLQSLRLNCFWHLLQEYGFSPVWILECCFNCIFRANVFPHSLHSNGLSPEWVRQCLIQSQRSKNPLKQTSHWNLFSFSWTLRMWVFKSAFSLNDASHWSHSNGRSSLCDRWCLVHGYL